MSRKAKVPILHSVLLPLVIQKLCLIPSGLFSVALSVGLHRLEVIKHRALCSSDFPHIEQIPMRDRLRCRDEIIITDQNVFPRSGKKIHSQRARRPRRARRKPIQSVFFASSFAPARSSWLFGFDPFDGPIDRRILSVFPHSWINASQSKPTSTCRNSRPLRSVGPATKTSCVARRRGISRHFRCCMSGTVRRFVHISIECSATSRTSNRSARKSFSARSVCPDVPVSAKIRHVAVYHHPKSRD